MNSQNVMNILGTGSFVVGFLLAVFTGWLWPDTGWLAATIVLLGAITGLLNITGREVMPFLVATIALLVIGRGDVFSPLNNFITGLGTVVNKIVDSVALFAAPAALVNAVRAAFALARPGTAK